MITLHCHSSQLEYGSLKLLAVVYNEMHDKRYRHVLPSIEMKKDI